MWKSGRQKAIDESVLLLSHACTNMHTHTDRDANTGQIKFDSISRTSINAMYVLYDGYEAEMDLCQNETCRYHTSNAGVIQEEKTRNLMTMSDGAV